MSIQEPYTNDHTHPQSPVDQYHAQYLRTPMIYFTETYTMTVESIAPCYVSRAETQTQESCDSKTLGCTLRVSKINLNTQTRGARNLVHQLPTSLGFY